MTEDDLLTAVIDLAHLFGLTVAHFRPARVVDRRTGRETWRTPVQADGKGYPDLTIVGPGGVLFRELKSATGTLSPEQRIWIYKLDEADADIGTWRPEDLRSGRIERELRTLRKPQSVRSGIPQRPRKGLSAIPQT